MSGISRVSRRHDTTTDSVLLSNLKNGRITQNRNPLVIKGRVLNFSQTSRFESHICLDSIPFSVFRCKKFTKMTQKPVARFHRSTTRLEQRKKVPYWPGSLEKNKLKQDAP